MCASVSGLVHRARRPQVSPGVVARVRAPRKGVLGCDLNKEQEEERGLRNEMTGANGLRETRGRRGLGGLGGLGMRSVTRILVGTGPQGQREALAEA